MVKHHIEFQNGQKMPILGLGTWQVEHREELEKALNDALTAGYRHFDTAYWSKNESIIGDVIQSWLLSGKVKREELFIVTKLPAIGMDESRVEHFLNLSLAALKLDYVDLYLIHVPIGLKYVDDVTLVPRESGKVALDMTTDHVKIWKRMEAQVEAGRAKSIGLSNFNTRQVERIVASAKILPASLQVETHLYFQQKEVRKTCAKHGISFCGYASFGSAGRKIFSEKRGMKEFQSPGVLNDPVVGSIAKSHGKTSAQVLLRFLIQSDITVIPKSTNAARIAENFAVFDFNLSPAEMKQLEDLDRGDAGRAFHLVEFLGAQDHPEVPSLLTS